LAGQRLDIQADRLNNQLAVRLHDGILLDAGALNLSGRRSV